MEEKEIYQFQPFTNIISTPSEKPFFLAYLKIIETKNEENKNDDNEFIKYLLNQVELVDIDNAAVIYF